MDTKEKIERLKLKADIFLREKTKAFVRDIYDNYYFCFIKPSNNLNKLNIKNFDGPRFDDGKIFETIYWVDVIDIQNFKESNNG